MQKAKLEQQNIVIEELKYNKIIEASKESLSCMRDEVRKTYYEIDKHLKPKIKCLTNELNIKEIEGEWCGVGSYHFLLTHYKAYAQPSPRTIEEITAMIKSQYVVSK